MASDLFHSPDTQSVDLTGLPEEVAQGIKQLVRALREGQASGSDQSSPAVESSPLDEIPSLVISRPKPSATEVDRLLDELSSGSLGTVLPADFSRADLYDDHD